MWISRYARRGAQVVLTFLLIGSMLIAGWNAWTLLSNPLVGLTVERTTDEIAARLDAALAREATPERMGERLDALLAAEPTDWSRIEAVVEMADARGVALPPETMAAVEAARSEDLAPTRMAMACAACIWDFDACTFANVFYCRVPVELTSAGDLASVARESVHYAKGEEVDEINLLLSTVGLGAVVIAPVVGGSSLSLKVGASLTKTAYRMGALGAGVLADGARAARRAIDWDMLARSRPGLWLDDLGKAVRPKAFRPIADFFRHVETMRGAMGARWTLFVLRKADSPGDVRKMSAVAKAGKAKTPGALEMLGSKRLLRLAVRFSDEALELAATVLSAAFAVLMLPFALGKSLALRGLRRLTREPGVRRGAWWWRWLTRGRGAGL